MIQSTRLTTLSESPVGQGRYVLYWMQASQRTRFNHALEYAIRRANASGLPVVVAFGLMDDYPDANLRHYAFMVQGLADVSRQLQARGIAFVARHGNPAQVAIDLARDAAEVVCDRGYLRHQRRWRDELADASSVRVTQVESDIVVPVQHVSDHAEFAARTIRPKITRLLGGYLKNVPEEQPGHSSLDLNLPSDLDVRDVNATLTQLNLDRSVAPSHRLLGGEQQAQRRLQQFIQHQLTAYDTARNEPSAAATSMLSAYLHFGQISPLQIVLAVQAAGAPKADTDALIEQLVIRRELAINHVFYTPAYDTFDALPAWAQRTLGQAAGDIRPFTYTRQDLEQARTHDPWWNAAMREMTCTGYMHNYMRMYWGKKVLEWNADPREAFADLLYLNNRYFLDGRDANGYTGVAWCFGLHDRPWTHRPIFGNVRYMNAAGLQRKFDMPAYARLVEGLSAGRPTD